MKTFKHALLLSLSLALGAVPSMAYAALDVVLNFDGNRIKGDHPGTPSGKYRDEIEILSFDWTISKPGQAGFATSTSLSLTKELDSSSVGLATELFLQGTGTNVVMTVLRPSAEPVPVMTLNLCDVKVVSLNSSGADGDDRVSETVELSFSKMTIRTYGFTAQGLPDPSLNREVSFDFATGTETSCGP